ncbi:MAG: acyl-ACP--UDP-N-acetylglucosamine O-acyltransferase [Gemmatimonadales bacterium]|jgi:UDP-N-acetylglucosamine acyltransferase
MIRTIHPTAVVDAAADIGADVEIGPYAVIGPDVRIGAHTRVGAHAVLEGRTTVGTGCFVGVGAILGAEPQDHKYAGEPTTLEIGDGTIIREYASLHRGTRQRGTTMVGTGCFLMAYVHIAHDCLVGDHVTIANAVQLAGHVEIQAHAQIGGLTPIHQFVRIGTWAFVGGGSRVPQDVPPYMCAAGNPLRLYGINAVGLQRAGFSSETRLALKHAYRILFNSELAREQAVDRLLCEESPVPEVRRLIEFVAASERGVLS